MMNYKRGTNWHMHAQQDTSGIIVCVCELEMIKE